MAGPREVGHEVSLLARAGKLARVAALAAALVHAGCEGATDPSVLGEGDNGTVDPTRLGDLYIYGELTRGQEPTEAGPLNLIDLETTLLAACYDELVYDDTPEDGLEVVEGPIREVCEGLDFQPDSDQTTPCQRNLCAQQLFLCLGMRNQELAQALAPVEVLARPMIVQTSPTLLANLNLDGTFDLNLSFNANLTPDRYDRAAVAYAYEIPPQAPPNRTLLLRFAAQAYREAAIRSVLVSNPSTCTWSIPGQGGAIEYELAADRTPTSEASPADLLVSGLSESVQRLADAVAAAIENERAVAATIPGRSGDTKTLAESRWQGEVNSEASVVSLVASRNLEAARRYREPVFRPPVSAPLQAAVGLLRAASVDISPERPLRGPDSIMADMVAVLHPGATDVDEAADRMLEAAGTNWTDLGEAREFLLEEREALGRHVTLDEGSDPEHPRYHGLGEPRDQLTEEALFAMVASAPHNLISGSTAFHSNYWMKSGAYAYQNYAGPFSTSGNTANLARFATSTGGTFSQQVDIPEGVSAVTFSVFASYYHVYVPQIQIKLETDGASQMETVTLPSSPARWGRYAVTLPITSESQRTVTVRISGYPTGGTYGYVYLWGAQLEVGDRSRALSPGADESPQVRSRAYAERGMIQAVDAARDAAANLLSSFEAGQVCASQSDCDEYEEVVAAAVREATYYAGDYRFRASYDADNYYEIYVYGARSGQDLTVVAGEDGLRCLLYGDVDGAPCHEDLAERILASTETNHFNFSHVRTGATSILGYADAYVEVIPGEWFFVVSDGEVIGGLFADGEAPKAAASGGGYGAPGGAVARATMPSESRMARPFLPPRDFRQPDATDENVCDMLAAVRGSTSRRWTPPLENELTTDDAGQGYESSWRHYLDLARTRAATADALGEEAIRMSAETDDRAEEAREEIERLCGVAVDTATANACMDGAESCDSRLRACMVAREDDTTSPSHLYDYVSLGGPLCMFRTIRGVCACDSSDGHPNCETAMANCPHPLGPGESCTSAPGGFFDAWLGTHSVIEVQGEAVELNVFPEPVDPDSATPPVVDCEALRQARSHAYRSGHTRDAIIAELRSMRWINPIDLAAAARQVRLQRAYPNYSYLTVAGRVMPTADSRVAPGDGTSQCPYVWPWRALGDVVPDAVCIGSITGSGCLRNVENQRIACASAVAPGDYTGLYQEHFETHGIHRMEWAQHMARALATLEGLAGLEEVRQPTSSSLTPCGGTGSMLFDGDGLDADRSDCRWSHVDDHEYVVRGGWSSGTLAGLPIIAVNVEVPRNHDDVELDPVMTADHFGVVVDCCDDDWDGLELYGPDICGGLTPPCENPCAGDIDCMIELGWVIEPREITLQDRRTRRPPAHATLFDRRLFEYLEGSRNISGLMSDIVTQFRSGSSHEYIRAEGCVNSEPNCGVARRMWGSAPGSHPAYYDVTRDDLWNALEMACWVLEDTGGGCDESYLTGGADPEEIPEALQCMADRVAQDMRSVAIPDMPQGLAAQLDSARTESMSVAYGGELLEAVLEVERGFSRMRSGVRELERAVAGAGHDFARFRAVTEVSRIREAHSIAQLKEQTYHAMTNLLRTVGTAIQGTNWIDPQTFAGSAMVIGAAFADLAITASYADIYRGLICDEHDAEIRVALEDLGNQALVRASACDASAGEIQDGYRMVEAGLERMHSIQLRVDQLLAHMTGRGSDVTGRAYPSMTARRRIENTHWLRYRRALRDARRASYLARRAIEFRLGVDMERMRTPLTLVDAPAQWADEICTLDGFDYTAISDYEEMSEGHFANAYVGDYVTNLENFVESYPIDFPFADSEDIGVLSLRELLAPNRVACWEENGPNLLYYSEDLWASRNEERADGEVLTRGWQTGGCTIEEGFEDACLVVEDNDEDSDVPGLWPVEEGPHAADLVADGADGDHRLSEAKNEGYVEQVVGGVAPGVYILTYWAADADGLGGFDYGVEVLTRDRYDGEWVVASSGGLVAPDDFERAEVYFDVGESIDGDGLDVAVRIYPSSVSGIPGADPVRRLWVWGVDLRSVPGWSCETAGNCGAVHDPDEYMPTGDDRGHWAGCNVGNLADFAFQQVSERFCTLPDGGACEPDSDGGCECYRELTFSLSLSELEQGHLLQTEPISSRNFNYRHGNIAVNLQGTNIVECGEDAPPSCYAAGFVPFTLEHSGDVVVRNWERQTVHYQMDRGRIERGRALASEVVPTNPLSTADRALFEDYWKRELRGRPLQGVYTLRIWEIPGLQWGNVEDIQVLLNYRYWTRFGD